MSFYTFVVEVKIELFTNVFCLSYYLLLPTTPPGRTLDLILGLIHMEATDSVQQLCHMYFIVFFTGDRNEVEVEVGTRECSNLPPMTMRMRS